jgi:N utilization substance protein A
MEALGQIAREKSVDRQVLIETLEAGLLSAAKKKLGASAQVTVDFDPDSGSISMKATMEVADDFDQVDRGYQIPLIEAKRLKPDARVGDRIDIQLPISKFGRNAIQAAKQVLIQRVREAERDRVFDEYHERVGELINGIVQQIDRGSVIVQLDRAESVLPAREQITRDRFRQGEHIRALIATVDRNAKGPQVVLTRASVDFVLRLFETEVPEIADGVVEIRAIAREPGARSKVAVFSNDDKVDAVGACVGIKGSRVQSIVRELNGERIDIVPWSSDPVLYVSRALSPAKAKQVIPLEDGATMRVVVDDDQLSLAIGKGGQNARLAAKLTGYKIDLMSEAEEARQHEFERLMRVEVEHLPGVGPKLAETLIRAGIETAAELAEMTPEALAEVPEIAPRTAHKLREIAEGTLAMRRAEVDAELARREEEAAAEAAAAAEAEAAAEAATEAVADATADGAAAAGMEGEAPDPAWDDEAAALAALAVPAGEIDRQDEDDAATRVAPAGDAETSGEPEAPDVTPEQGLAESAAGEPVEETAPPATPPAADPAEGPDDTERPREETP